MKEKIIAQLKETKYHLTCLEAELVQLLSLAHTSDDLRAILSKMSDLERGFAGASLTLSTLCEEVAESLEATSQAV